MFEEQKLKLQIEKRSEEVKVWTDGWSIMRPRNSSLPGDSKWPFYPLIGGHLTP